MRDLDIRTCLLSALEAEHQGDANTRVVQEMGIWSGSVRIDVAVINGELQGYELKSDRDTLQRLPAQAELYSRVFDRVHLVVGSRHAAKSLEHIPGWWGVITAVMQDGFLALERTRVAETNPAHDLLQVARLLWRAEALTVLERHGLAANIRSKSISFFQERMVEALSPETLRLEVRSALKHRAGWLGQPASHKG